MKSKTLFIAAQVFIAAALAGCSSAKDEQGAQPGSAPAQAASVMAVDVVHPLQETWPRTVSVNGALAAWQEIIVSPETGGYRIVELRAEVGDRVKAGQLLARLSDASLKVELRKEEAAVAQAQANLEQAISNLRRARQAEGSGALSAQKIEEYRISEETSRASLASAKADLDNTRLKLSQTRIVAVDDGVISSKSGVLGNVVSAGAEIYRMIRKGKVEWQAEMSAQQLALIRVNDAASVSLPSGEIVQGRVRSIAPALSSSTGRGIIYVSLADAKNARPGIFADGTFLLENKAATTLPQSAIVMKDGRAYVYAVNDRSIASSRRVETGRVREDRIEIVSALEPDTSVVAAGGAFLSEGARVSVPAKDKNRLKGK